MSWLAAAPAAPERPGAIGRLVSLWNREIPDDRLKLAISIVTAVFASYVVVCVKMLATGTTAHGFGDFYALWSSAIVTHDGAPSLNYDADALHLRQIALGMNPHEYNPFPYPPTFLLVLAPLGALGRAAAFLLFMSTSLALYVWAMAGGRALRWPWILGALCAPATGVTLISGQTGFLSGALMVGGLRLAASRPILSGILLGLLTFKPQLGVLVPIALVAAGLWRTIASAVVTVAVCMLASSLAFGFEIWPTWARSILQYGARFDLVVDLMPMIRHDDEISKPVTLPVEKSQRFLHEGRNLRPSQPTFAQAIVQPSMELCGKLFGIFVFLLCRPWFGIMPQPFTQFSLPLSQPVLGN